MNIREFKPGDLITRNEPSAPFNGPSFFWDKSEPHRDRSYIGSALTLAGIENGLIVLKSRDHEEPTILAEDKWGDGWVLYPIHLIAQAL